MSLTDLLEDKANSKVREEDPPIEPSEHQRYKDPKKGNNKHGFDLNDRIKRD